MTRQTRRRGGFTLIELLVVIAIIAILFALTTAGVFRYLQKIPEITTKNEISQLSNALQTFKAKFGIYPPSRIFLANNRAAYDAFPKAADYPFRQQSLAVLHKLWPRLSFADIDWTGANPGPTWSGILEGDQCLVYFLSGIPDQNPGALGFRTDGTNPTRKRLPAPPNPPNTFVYGGEIKFFTGWATNRLIKRPGSPFYSYVDAYGTSPAAYYAYFSAGLRENEYQPLDCVGINAAAYLEANTPTLRYHNPSSYQLISAGKNRAFAPPNYPFAPATSLVVFWSPATAAGAAGAAGADDITNFYDNFMGVTP